MKKKASILFRDGFNCAQAVFAACNSIKKLDDGLAGKIACAFGGGVARKGHICGAVSGALMAIGAKYGSSEPSDRNAKENTYALSNVFIMEFEKKHGSIMCKKLLGCDISTKKGLEQIARKDLHRKICLELVRDAVKMTKELL